MTMKGYSAFTKAPALLKPHTQIVTEWEGPYPFGEMQLVYSTASADWSEFYSRRQILELPFSVVCQKTIWLKDFFAITSSFTFVRRMKKRHLFLWTF